MLRSVNRLKKRKEFAYLYSHGTAKHTAHLTVVYLPTKYRKVKIGFSITRKIGKAHTRNLVKRRLRGCVREIVPSLKDNYNVVFIAKAGIDTLPYAELVREVGEVIAKTELLR